MYDDYRIALFYECLNLLDDNTCRPGFETILAYSRQNERWSEETIQHVFSLVSDECVTRDDFEWILEDGSKNSIVYVRSKHKVITRLCFRNVSSRRATRGLSRAPHSRHGSLLQ